MKHTVVKTTLEQAVVTSYRPSCSGWRRQSNKRGWIPGIKMPRRIRSSEIRCMADQENVGLLRSIPLLAGGVGIIGTLINRVAAGTGTTLMATSSQSRLDVIVILCSAALTLTGLQWLALKPRKPVSVELDGVETTFFDERLPKEIKAELNAAWKAASWASRTKMVVVFYKGKCIAHLGQKKAMYQAGEARAGKICLEVLTRGAGSYLANLSLFPGRQEFFEYLPSNTQSLIIKPCGKHGVVVLGADAQRGYTILDQAWISLWIDKLEVALEKLH